MASNNSVWLTDSESYSSGGSCSTVIHHSPSGPSNVNQSPSSEPLQPRGFPRGGSLLATSFAKRTVVAAGNERFSPSRVKTNGSANNSTQSWASTTSTTTPPRKTTIKIVEPSLAEIQARRTRYNARKNPAVVDRRVSRARASAEQEKDFLDGEVQHENFVTGMCRWLDGNGERDTKNTGGQDTRVWTCCGCECYNSGHEHLCSHCRLHVKCGDCERREEQQGRFRIRLE
ncbi:hypothetical protein QBC41DRAFT_303347 [Cercophora samala]|uniref:RanBP2-type domain-containing protein n=1 Tax=Cercophora samala TaxID=330535 RepID=A0AA40D9Q2_9PEZI|nr:hypothetical protein QBC41DRAFT_303347 [Cercophora samala]